MRRNFGLSGDDFFDLRIYQRTLRKHLNDWIEKFILFSNLLIPTFTTYLEIDFIKFNAESVRLFERHYQQIVNTYYSRKNAKVIK